MPSKPWRKKAPIDKYFTKIEKYLHIGLSLYKACLHADVPYSTVMDHIAKDDEFSEKIERSKEFMQIKAKQVIFNEIEKWNYKAAKEYLASTEGSEALIEEAVKTRIAMDIDKYIGLLDDLGIENKRIPFRRIRKTVDKRFGSKWKKDSWKN